MNCEQFDVGHSNLDLRRYACGCLTSWPFPIGPSAIGEVWRGCAPCDKSHSLGAAAALGQGSPFIFIGCENRDSC